MEEGGAPQGRITATLRQRNNNMQYTEPTMQSIHESVAQGRVHLCVPYTMYNAPLSEMILMLWAPKRSRRTFFRMYSLAQSGGPVGEPGLSREEYAGIS